jgi:xylulokinase
VDCCIAALDCGTSWTKGAIVGLSGETLGAASRRAACVTTPDSGFEVDPGPLLRQTDAVLREALARAGVAPGKVAAVAVTNQRATVFPLDARGRPLGMGLSWQDLRGGVAMARLGRRLPASRFRELTGLPFSPVFSAGKLFWLRQAEPERFRATARFALVQDLVLHHLGATGFPCDLSNASLTGLLDVAGLGWSRELLDWAGVGAERLPALVPSGLAVGRLSRAAARRTGLLAGLPLVSGGGDQQCAGVGAGAVEPGVVELTLGTVAAPLCCTAGPVTDPRGRLSCGVHAVPGRWELEGLQTSAGSSLEWAAKLLNDGRRFTETTFSQVEEVAPGAGGVLFLPYLAGPSAPRWREGSAGALVGLRLSHGKAELLRAVLEGISLQTREILEALAELTAPIREVRLTGGASSIGVWNRMQADLLGLPVATLANPQATLVGAAILGACGAGVFGSVSEAAGRMVRIAERHRPRAGLRATYRELYQRYLAAHDWAAPPVPGGRK